MRSTARPGWLAVAAASAALLVADLAVSAGETADRATASRWWIEGNVEATLDALRGAGRDRQGELNEAVVRLYAGQATVAAAALQALRTREDGWTPALRWAARAEAQLGRPEALDSAAALLARPDADVLDRLWAGELFLRNGRAGQAHAAFEAVLRSNGAIQVEWQRPGEVEAARAVARQEPLPLPDLPATAERLRYEVKYLFFHLASATLDTGTLAEHGGRLARQVVFTARSGSGIPFFHIDSRFESLVAADGTVLAHRHVADDSDAGADQAGYDMDRRSGTCTVRTSRDGLFSYHVLPLPENAQDGVSVMLAARALARAGGTAVLPTAVDGMWWPTELRTLGVETIRWRGRQLRAVHVQSVGRYRGAGGITGVVDIWVSDDERAVPYRVKMKVAVGSVVLELVPEQPLVARGTGAGEVGR